MVDPAGTGHNIAWEVGVGVIRPYLFTHGRTTPVELSLAVESMLVANPGVAFQQLHELALEQQTIVALCRVPRSVAEVAAKLSVPLGVVRVLVADLCESQLLEVCTPPPPGDGGLAADVELLQRLIRRVRAIV